MGCAISGLAEKADLGEKSTHDAGGRGEHLRQDQIDMIKESWKVIRDDIAKVGIIVFVRLFETHPECKDVFFLFRDVKDLERLRTSRELRAHGLRVMSFIEKSVARLDQLDRLELLAMELGKSHYHYNAPPKYYSYVGAEFISAVQPILKDRWTAELEEAWKTMFQYVTCLMKQGYEEEDKQNQVAVSTKERVEKTNTAL
ncbi:x globin [Corythoichthys intestinalis]|uniref:x globin n=1 Tax=Corythoichthys intestinalis TaxID=161448 RepID=UPI0025A55216|nr:x globin [Corythoichthys intestinalis]XP_061798974.1 neuroglobin-like [Nerophis lumbriciformis]